MLTIRFSRVGKKNQPTFRLVIMDKRHDPWGKSLENLGWYNPRTKEKMLKTERIAHWIQKGAEASDSVWNMLVGEKLVEGKKRSVTTISARRKKEMAGASAPAPTAVVVEAKAPEAKIETPAAVETPAA